MSTNGSFRRLFDNHSTPPLTKAIGELTTVALFWGMRSCEFSTVPEERNTKSLQLQYVWFFVRRREINKLTELREAEPDSVSVRFTRQKNNVREATITMYRTGE